MPFRLYYLPLRKHQDVWLKLKRWYNYWTQVTRIMEKLAENDIPFMAAEQATGEQKAQEEALLHELFDLSFGSESVRAT